MGDVKQNDLATISTTLWELTKLVAEQVKLQEVQNKQLDEISRALMVMAVK